MSLRTYQEVRPWAKAIKQAVALRTMPPWSADPAVNHFANDRRLTDGEITTLSKWADLDAPEGDRANLPLLPEFVEGWTIGKPDLVVDIGQGFEIPAQGVVPYEYFVADSAFKEDTRVQAAEVRPTQRAQVHHALVFVKERGLRLPHGGEDFSSMLIGYAPGAPSIAWDPETAFLV